MICRHAPLKRRHLQVDDDGNPEMTNASRAAAVAVLTGFFSTVVMAHDFNVGDLTIDHPFSYATPPTAKAGAGYMTITNNGAEADRLIDVKTDFSRNAIHESNMVSGIMKMIFQAKGVEIPAGGSVTFEPGGLHVMFMDLEAPLKHGERLPATLVFDKAGDVPIVFDVSKRGADAGVGHGAHMKPE